MRLTADCPLADPGVIDDTIDAFLDAGADYASNTPPRRTFPKGLDVEVFTAEALRRAAIDPSPEAREHVTWDMFRQPQHYRDAFHNQTIFEDEVRWTVDRPDDYEFAAAVYDALYKPLGPLFTAWCAANRVTPSGRVLGPSQRLRVDEALHAITLGPAWTLKLDHEIGSIECGKRADFCVLEDDPLFNAGHGAVFTSDGRNELDASIMDGATLAAGAVAGITTTRHPS